MRNDDLCERLKRYSTKCLAERLDPDFAEAVREAADVQPVKHGKWIADGDGYHWTYNCSICGWKDGYPFNERHNFCPNCGARMDG